MTDNVVQIKVKASDTAKPDLTDLKAKLAELGATVESARVSVDDKDAAATLLDLNARLASLNKSVANPKITVAGAARVEAQLAMVDAQLGKIGEKKDSVDIKARTSGFAAALTSITGLDTGLKDAQESGSKFKLAMAALNVATGIAEPLLAGAAAAAGGLVSGFAAAGAGLGVFEAVAKSALTTASTAATAAQTAQTSYTAAVAAANFTYQQQMETATTAAQRKAAETKRATALQAAEAAQVKATTAAYQGLTPAQEDLANTITKVKNEWSGFVAANTSGVSAILTKGMGLLPKIFADMQPFLAPVEQALSHIIGQLSSGLNSGGFKSFLTDLSSNTGPAIEKIATAVGHVVVGIGGILKAFMPMSQTMLSGVDTLTAKFAKWGSTLTSHTGFQSLISMFKSETPLAVHALEQLAGIAKNVVSAITGLDGVSNSKTLLQLANPVLDLANALTKANPDLVRIALYLLMAADAGKKLQPVFSGISSGISLFKGGASALQDLQAGFGNSAAAASSATGIFGTLGGSLATMVTAIKGWGIWSKIASAATKVWTVVQAAFNAVMDANPIAIAIIAIAALVAGVIYAYTHFKSFRDGVKEALHAVAEAVSTVVSFVADHWKLLVAIILGPLGLIIDALVTHWHAVEGGFKTAWDFVSGVVKTAIGVITGILKPFMTAIETLFKTGWAAVQAVWHAVWDALKAFIQTEINGIKNILNWFAGIAGMFRRWWDDAVTAVRSEIDKLMSWVEKIPSRVNSALGGLPGMLFKAGVHAIEGLINGITSMFGAIGSTMGKVASKIAGFIGLSPAVEGPLSGGGAPEIRGSHIPMDIAKGMLSQLGSVQSAARRIASAGGTAAGVASAGPQGNAFAQGAPAVIHLQFDTAGGDQSIITAFAKAIRVRGGNVQAVLGH